MNSTPIPKFSIGMPVFNGEEYIARAIDSVLAQSEDRWELLICDNASTDRTEEICREYCRSDSRIHYHRNPQNIGAHPNYNRTLRLAKGDYFKWLAHDDELEPEFLEQCGNVLDIQSDAVLCMTDIRYIDENSADIGVLSMRFDGSESPSGPVRFRTFVNGGHSAYHVFSLIRLAPLLNSVQLMSFHGSDRALIADLSLRGSFAHIDNPLSRVREHEARYTNAKTAPKERAAWHDASLAGKVSLPTWRLYGEYIGIVSRSTIPNADKLYCYSTLLAWWCRNWNLFRMIVDVVAVVFPRFVRLSESIKQRLFSPAPGADQVRTQRP